MFTIIVICFGLAIISGLFVLKIKHSSEFIKVRIDDIPVKAFDKMSDSEQF